MEKRLNFKVLGPLEVTSHDAQVPVGGPRHRTILVMLLLSPGRIVAVDTLIEAVWGDRPPATARTQVSICIAALRKTFKAAGFPGEVIVTAHPGYLLQVGMHRLDSEEFSALVSSAELAVRNSRPAEAARCYAEALALWRGRPLDGVTGRLVEDEARRLEELRLDTYENATAVHIQLGEHQKILPDLAAMVREHPLRERARHQLITAQYQSGRRAEALETFRDGRRWMIEELGLEPGPALSELHNAILQDELSPAVPGPDGEGTLPSKPVGDPLELPPDVPGLAGRKEELAQLDELLTPAVESNGPATGLITGVGGVGKTGLAVHWAHQVAEHFPDGQLFADLRGYDEHLEPTTAGEILGRFLRSLSVPTAQIPSEPEERAALYRSLLADRRVLVVLDNVRSYAQVRPLLPGSGGCCVLVTSREQLSEMLAWPPRSWVRLGRLSPYEAVELLEKIVGEERVAADPPSAARLAELCDLLPLALRIAGARLASKPHWTVSRLVRRLSDERQRLDELSSGESQVRASFALTYRGLTAATALLYRRLGLLDAPDFGAWVAAALLDTDLLTGERLVEQLVDAQFLDVVGLDATGHPRYRFQNLLRLFARERAEAEDTAEDRRAAQERAFRAYLALAEQAHQRAFGGDFSVIHSAVPRYRLPGELGEGLLTDPLGWLETERLSLVAVVDQAAALGLDELAWDLTMSVVVLFETRNYLDDWRECSERALAAARVAGNARGQAAMLHNLGALEMRLRHFSKAYASFTEALELHGRAGEEHGHALVLRNMAMIDEMRGDLDRAVERSTRALEVFRAVGDLSSEAHVLNNMAQIELDRGQTDAAQRLSLESLRVSAAIGEGGSRSLALGTHRLARVYLAQKRYALAEEAFLRMIGVVRAQADMLGLAHGLLGLGEARLGAESWGQARATLAQALEIAGLVDSALVEGKIKLALGEACWKCGDRVAARRHFSGARTDFARIGVAKWTERARLALAGTDPVGELPAEVASAGETPGGT
ncbi:transcriptional regulator [Streptomyces nitrosporeus]|uniref:Transcriptional regulator n=1 Tax=Streptomyces nitrosporeus TaxID=28894 RepID=A0A5J6FBN2_9ACTN|nr:AfsR/SARP family transcriptional regulator [Streptomyces nitrosporeus]QEU73899.1 transcriptional regulator [Streptomyces nitrosporeus]GGZ01396.1 SARP family transcriptional regulator [Streptomyces nitrosporeus]